EGTEQPDDLALELAWDLARDGQDADDLVFTQQWDSEERAMAGVDQRSPDWALVGSIGGDIGDLDGFPPVDDTGRYTLASANRRCAAAERLKDRGVVRIRVVTRPQAEFLACAVVLPDRAARRPRELVRSEHDGLEDGLQVERRAQGVTNLSESCQLVDRTGQLIRP